MSKTILPFTGDVRLHRLRLLSAEGYFHMPFSSRFPQARSFYSGRTRFEAFHFRLSITFLPFSPVITSLTTPILFLWFDLALGSITPLSFPLSCSALPSALDFALIELGIFSLVFSSSCSEGGFEFLSSPPVDLSSQIRCSSNGLRHFLKCYILSPRLKVVFGPHASF